MLNYIIMCIVPLMMLFIIVIAAKEKKDIFKLFIEGALDGLKVVYNIFPYILAITISIGLLKSTGALDVILYPFKPLLVKFGIPEDIIPLCIMRPLSGGASMSVVMEIFKTSGDMCPEIVPRLVKGHVEAVLILYQVKWRQL